MDFRRRKYYLVHLGYYTSYEQNLNKLKGEIKSLKLRPAYNHFNHSDAFGYDGFHVKGFIGSKYAQFMASCRIEESEKFEEAFKSSIAVDTPIFVEVTKEMLNNKKMEREERCDV